MIHSMQLSCILVISVAGLGVERMEQVDRILKKMRLDADRDVRMLAGGEELLVNTVSQDCVVVSQDEMEEEPRNQGIVFQNEFVYCSRAGKRIIEIENELFVSQDAPPFFHTSD